MGAGGMEIPSYSRKKRFIKMRDRKSDNRAKEVGCRNGLFLAQNVAAVIKTKAFTKEDLEMIPKGKVLVDKSDNHINNMGTD